MIFHRGRPAVLKSEIDITDKKLAHEELKASQKQRKELTVDG